MGRREKGCGKEGEGMRGGGRREEGEGVWGRRRGVGREKGCGEGEGVWGGRRRGVGKREKGCGKEGEEVWGGGRRGVQCTVYYIVGNFRGEKKIKYLHHTPKFHRENFCK